MQIVLEIFFGRKHHFNTSLFNTPGVHQGWEKPMQLEYANYIQLQTIFPQSFTDIVGLASIDSYGNNVVQRTSTLDSCFFGVMGNPSFITHLFTAIQPVYIRFGKIDAVRI